MQWEQSVKVKFKKIIKSKWSKEIPKSLNPSLLFYESNMNILTALEKFNWNC